MKDIYLTRKYQDYEVHIVYPDYDCNPQLDLEVMNVELEEFGTFIIYNHRMFTVNVKGYSVKDVYDNSVRVKNRLSTYENFYAIPLYAYIHSGIVLSIHGFNDVWDTSLSGFVLVPIDDILLNTDNIDIDIIKKDEEEAIAKANKYVELWNDYLSGNVFTPIFYKKRNYVKQYEDGEVINGYDLQEIVGYNHEIFYGDDFTKNGINDYIDYVINNLKHDDSC